MVQYDPAEVVLTNFFIDRLNVVNSEPFIEIQK
jgi:hypothetical protein